VIVELPTVPGCPNLEVTRDLHACLADVGLPLVVTERIGAYPSPSVLINGRHVTGADPQGPAVCVRPSIAEQIHAALSEAATAC
jgi:hypothetical protein